MDSHSILEAIGDINDDAIYDAKAGAATASRLHIRRRLPAAMIAAVMALLLMGAGIVAVIYGDSIQNWFGHYWRAVTGQELSSNHADLIEQLSQHIGSTQTVDDVTVTVDSATVGDNCFFLLLRVGGIEFSEKYSYGFEEVVMEVSPDPAKNGEALVGYGFQFQGVDGDGSALMLMDYNYSEAVDFIQSTEPFDVTLSLRNLVQNATTDHANVIAEGDWTFSFSLDRSQSIGFLEIPDADITVFDMNKQKYVPALLTDVTLTSTGIHFQLHFDEEVRAADLNIMATLDNGIAVRNAGGAGHPAEGTFAINYSYMWTVPIEIEHIDTIRVGTTEITVNEPKYYKDSRS